YLCYLYSFPTRRSSDLRCEVCHQTDCFDPETNYCTRCDFTSITEWKKKEIVDNYNIEEDEIIRENEILLNEFRQELVPLKLGFRSEEHTSELQSRGHLV